MSSIIGWDLAQSHIENGPWCRICLSTNAVTINAYGLSPPYTVHFATLNKPQAYLNRNIKRYRKKMLLELSSGEYRFYCSGLNLFWYSEQLFHLKSVKLLKITCFFKTWWMISHNDNLASFQRWLVSQIHPWVCWNKPAFHVVTGTGFIVFEKVQLEVIRVKVSNISLDPSLDNRTWWTPHEDVIRNCFPNHWPFVWGIRQSLDELSICI